MLRSSDLKLRTLESGKAAIIILAVLVVVAAGAMVFLSGKIGKDAPVESMKTASAEQPAASEPASGEEATGQATAEGEPARIEPGNPVVAKIGDKDITRIDVFNFIQTLPPNTRQMPIDQLFPLALDQVINAQLIAEHANQEKLDNDPEVKKQLELAKQQIVRSVYLQKEADKALTDDRLKAAYDEYVSKFPEIPEVKARHILVEDEATAKDVIKKLQDGGDFAALAQEYSIDATKENGGDLNYFSKQDVVPEFADAAFSMKVGEVSKKPVKSDFGYHIIEVTDSRMREPAPYEQAKPLLAAQMRNQVLAEVVQEWRSAAKVEIFDINGQPIEPASGAAPEGKAE